MFSHDGDRIATLGRKAPVDDDDRGPVNVVAIWGRDGDAPLHRRETPGDWREVAFDPQGRGVFVGIDNAVVLWDPTTGADQFRIDGFESRSRITISSDGAKLAVVGPSDANVYQADTGAQICRFEVLNRNRQAAVFSPDGTRLATPLRRLGFGKRASYLLMARIRTEMILGAAT